MLYKPKKQIDFSNWENIGDVIDTNFKHLKEIDNQQEAKGEPLLYRYFFRSVADGRAHYQVVKVGAKDVTIALCDGICPDGYADPMFGKGCKLPRHLVEQMVNGRIAMDRLFSQK